MGDTLIYDALVPLFLGMGVVGAALLVTFCVYTCIILLWARVKTLPRDHSSPLPEP